MNEIEFENELVSELEKHSNLAKETIISLLETIPDKAENLYFEVFPSQDGDGFFSIRANVDGPNLSTLNKAIYPHADIFDPSFTETGIEPPIPMIDPFSSDYEANDIVVDCSAKWLKKVWASIEEKKISIPVLIVGHDEYGTITPVELT